MTIRVRKTTHITFEAPEIGDFELTHPPVEGFDPLIEVVGDHAVVAYLVQDSDGQNPLENDCAGGELVTKAVGRDSTIWDDESRLRTLLRCGDGRWSGENPDIDRAFVDETGKQTTLREMAVDRVFAEVSADPEEVQDFVKYLEVEPEEAEDPQLVADLIRTNLLDDNGFKCEEVEREAFDLYEEHWDRLVGPFVIPIDYRSYNDVRIRTTAWDGDPSDLPDGVWMADDDAIENILAPFVKGYLLGAHVEKATKTVKRIDGTVGTYEVDVPFYNLVIDGAIIKGNIRGTVAANALFMGCVGWKFFHEIQAAARKYADNVLTEVSAWASGECYGCVVETYQKVDDAPTWERVEEDACWGYLGSSAAEEILKTDFFGAAVKALHG